MRASDGNARELQNLLERAVILSRDGKLYLEPAWLPSPRPWDFAQETQTSGAEYRKTLAFKLRYR